MGHERFGFKCVRLVCVLMVKGSLEQLELKQLVCTIFSFLRGDCSDQTTCFKVIFSVRAFGLFVLFAGHSSMETPVVSSFNTLCRRAT